MHRKEFKISIFTLAIAIAVVLLIGAIIFSYLEGWSFINAFYFVTMTATTVGYGDFIPTHKWSKVFTIIFSLSIVPFVLYAFSIVAKYQTERVYHKIHGLERKQEEQEEEIDKTEKKITTQHHKLKEQEEELDKQEEKMKKQTKLNKKQEEEIDKHKKELKGHQKKIKEQSEINKEQTKEIKEHDKELEVVEDIVEEELVKKK